MKIRNVLECEKWRTKPCLKEFSNYSLRWDNSIAGTHCEVQAVQRNGLLRQQLHWRVCIDGDWSAAHWKTHTTFNLTDESSRVKSYCSLTLEKVLICRTSLTPSGWISKTKSCLLKQSVCHKCVFMLDCIEIILTYLNHSLLKCANED